MNHTYRLVWNDAEQCQVPAPENARGRGKRTGVKPLAAALLAAFACNAHALPTGGEITAGNGSIGQTGMTTTVNQTTQNLAINWQSFGIAANEAVNFNQPNASAIALNRVLGSDPSQILGQLNANGQVWVLNPNGVLFGRTAQVNVGGLVASTLNISDADFLAGKRTFTHPSPASGRGAGGEGVVLNQGSINATNGGYVALLGGQVSNEGVIVARLGTVALAAGNKVTLDFNGDQLLNVQVEQGALDALAQNSQLIRADGGTVLMTAQAADALATAVVNNTGVVEARTIENRNGVIKLLGDMAHGTVNVGGTLDASSPNGGDGGFIETSAAHVKVADGTIVTTLAANGNNGTWLIDPVDFTIAASGGDMTGATVSTALLGGNFTIQSANGASGTAGDINVNDSVIWSSNTLTLNAQNNININSAMMGSGTAGLALEYGQGAVAAGNTSTYNVNAPVNLASTGSFSTKLGSDGVATPWTVITTLGAFDSNTGTDLQGMVGNKGGHYVLGADIDAAATSGWYDNGAGGFYGFVPVGTAGAGQAFTGGFDGLGHTVSNLYINRPATDNIGLFGLTGTVTLSNVGLLNANVTGKVAVGTLLGYSGTGIVNNSYATGTVSGLAPVNGYVGGLVGISVTINDSHADVTVNGSGSQVGGLAGSILHINRSYATGSVTGTSSVGGLAGYGRDVTDSYATGNVSGSSSKVGGLVGWQGNGSISNSYATGSVGGTSDVGGLVGYTADVTSSIVTSYASGAVTGSGNRVGGLVGTYLGAISNSYATGSASGASNVGGLVGELDGGVGVGTITNSYATGAVSASVANPGGLLGLLSNGASVTTSYWDTVTTGQLASAGGAGAVGMTTAQLAAALPTGFASATWGNAGNQTTPYLLGHSGFNTAGPTYLGSDGAVSPTAYGVILNVNQLQAMSNNLAGKYVLGNNIDASATATWNANGAGGYYGFAPVGTFATPFTGIFDGLGHTISALTINRPATDYVALFGYANAATLRNVGLLNASISGKNSVGTLLGIGITNTAIDNSYAEGGSVNAAATQSGGLAGRVSGTLGNSHAAVAVTSSSNTTGGLVGYSAAAISNSYASGSVSGTHTVGGLVGGAGSGSIANSYASGNVSGTNTKVGGLAGEQLAVAISNSYASGNVSGTGDTGGLVGLIDNAGATVANSYASGTASGTSNVGGLVGTLNAGIVSTSYATGAVNASVANAGGLVGYNSGTIGGFWNSDVETAGYGFSNGTFNAVGKTTAEMKSLATFAGWDIDAAGGTGKVWRIFDGYTNPLLRGFLTALNVQPIYDGSGAALTNVGAAAVVGAHDAGKVFTGGLYADTLTLGSTAVDAYTATSTARNLYSNQSGYDLVSVARSIVTPGSASGDIALTSAINWSSGTLAINTVGTVSQTAAINGSGTAIFDMQAGTWNQVNGTLPGFAAYDFRISGGSFVRALSGDGTVGTPYQLADIYGMQGMGSSGMLNKHYTLANDVAASGTANWNGGAGFTPVGPSFANRFTGSFEGQGHTLSGLTIDRAGADAVGLFGSSSGALRNLTLTGSDIRGNDEVGILVGDNIGSIEAVHTSGTVTGRYNIGGLAGYSTGAISASDAAGSISGTDSVGGLVGWLNNTGTIDASHATATVTGDTNIGGLVGYHAGVSVTDSYATGAVTGNVDWAGGLAGFVSAATISGSYASGAVNGGNLVGGLAGIIDNSATITDSYATGAVTGSGNNVGGLAGSVTTTSSIERSYATGAVAGGSVGGLVGNVDGTSSVNTSFWDSDVEATGVGTNAGTFTAVGKTTAEMKQLSTFTGGGWDIDDAGGTGKVWRIYEGNTNPLLRNFLTALTVTANNATTTYSGAAYSGGNGVTKSNPAAVLLGSASYGGSSQGATNIGSYILTVNGYWSNQQGYDIAFANGMLTIAAGVPTVPGAPPDGYAGAIAPTSGGGVSGSTPGGTGGKTAGVPILLASVEGAGTTNDADAKGATNSAAPFLPGIPGLSIIPCGQSLPPAISNGCQ